MTCTVGTLPAGQSKTFLIAVKAGNVANGTVLNNSVTVSSSTPDPNTGNNTDTETTTVQTPIGPVTDLAITKVDLADPVIAGQTVNYSIAVTNAGPLTATNVQVLDLVPAGTTVVSISANNPDFAGAFCSLGGVCNLGTLNAGSTAFVTLSLKVDAGFAGNTLINSVSVSADQADTNIGNNIASATTTVNKSADLSLSKVGIPDPVNAGDVLVYQLLVSNSGPSDAQNVVLTDNLPAGTTFMDATPGCSAVAQAVTCSLGTVAAGSTRSLFIAVKVSQSTPDNTTLSNTATLSTNTPDPNSGNNSATDTTVVKQSPLNPTDVQITKSDSPDPVLAGQNLTYTLVVKNNGPAVASNVIVVDALPSGVSLISATSTQGTCNSGVTCSLGDLAVGGTATITLVVKVNDLQFADLLNYRVSRLPTRTAYRPTTKPAPSRTCRTRRTSASPRRPNRAQQCREPR